MEGTSNSSQDYSSQGYSLYYYDSSDDAEEEPDNTYHIEPQNLHDISADPEKSTQFWDKMQKALTDESRYQWIQVGDNEPLAKNIALKIKGRARAIESQRKTFSKAIEKEKEGKNRSERIKELHDQISPRRLPSGLISTIDIGDEKVPELALRVRYKDWTEILKRAKGKEAVICRWIREGTNSLTSTDTKKWHTSEVPGDWLERLKNSYQAVHHLGIKALENAFYNNVETIATELRNKDFDIRLQLLCEAAKEWGEWGQGLVEKITSAANEHIGRWLKLGTEEKPESEIIERAFSLLSGKQKTDRVRKGHNQLVLDFDLDEQPLEDRYSIGSIVEFLNLATSLKSLIDPEDPSLPDRSFVKIMQDWQEKIAKDCRRAISVLSRSKTP